MYRVTTIQENIQENNYYRLIPRDLLGWVLFLFVVSSMTAFGANQMRAFGIFMVLAFALSFIRKPMHIQKESLLYIAWAFWCILGLAKAPAESYFWKDYWVVFQMCPMIVVIAGICGERGTMATTFLSLLIGASILFFTSLFTGEISQIMAQNSESRATGITFNANHYGYNLLLGVMASMYFWRKRITFFFRAISYSLALAMLIGILASGSRKSFVGFLVLCLFWFFLCYRKQAPNPLLFVGVSLVGLFALAGVTHYMISKTVMGERFNELISKDERYLEEKYSRTILYKEGLRVFAHNPVIGIGLGNFRAVSSLGVYTHSDYLEIAVSSGLPGFLLHFSIYAFLLLRLRRLNRVAKDELTTYTLGLIKAGVYTILLLAFGRPNYIAMQTWVFLASAVGYTWHLERMLAEKTADELPLKPNLA